MNNPDFVLPNQSQRLERHCLWLLIRPGRDSISSVLHTLLSLLPAGAQPLCRTSTVAKRTVSPSAAGVQIRLVSKPYCSLHPSPSCSKDSKPNNNAIKPGGCFNGNLTDNDNPLSDASYLLLSRKTLIEMFQPIHVVESLQEISRRSTNAFRLQIIKPMLTCYSLSTGLV
jgi:hypothetical protein